MTDGVLMNKIKNTPCITVQNKIMQQQSTVLTMAMFWQRGCCWRDVVLNVHPTNKDKVIMPRRVSTRYLINLSTTTKCCQEHKTMHWRYFKTNNSEHNLHERRNDNDIRVLNFAISKIPCSHIKTLIQIPAFIPNGRHRIKWITSCWTDSVRKLMYMQTHKMYEFSSILWQQSSHLLATWVWRPLNNDTQ